MADYIKQLEPMIYYTRWQAHMELQIIARDADYISQLADDNADDRYVVILDMSDNINFSMDIKGLTGVAKADPRLLGYVIINGDNTAKFIGKILKPLSKHDFKFCDNYVEALQYARNLLPETTHR